LILWRVCDDVASKPVPIRIDLGAVGALNKVEVTRTVSSAAGERVTESSDASRDVVLLTGVRGSDGQVFHIEESVTEVNRTLQNSWTKGLVMDTHWYWSRT
jgi:hypothetical protein